MDALPVICPMTDLATYPSDKDIDQGTHFMIASGNHVKSYLSFAIDHIPLEMKELNITITQNEEEVKQPNITRLFTVKKNYFMVSYYA